MPFRKCCRRGRDVGRGALELARRARPMGAAVLPDIEHLVLVRRRSADTLLHRGTGEVSVLPSGRRWDLQFSPEGFGILVPEDSGERSSWASEHLHFSLRSGGGGQQHDASVIVKRTGDAERLDELCELASARAFAHDCNSGKFSSFVLHYEVTRQPPCMVRLRVFYDTPHAGGAGHGCAHWQPAGSRPPNTRQHREPLARGHHRRRGQHHARA